MKLQGGFLVFFAAVAACSGHSTFDGEDSGGPGNDGGNNNNDQYVPPNNDSGMNFGDTGTDGPGMGGVTTVYANTDDTLYSLNPMTNAVTQIGMFTGFGGGTNDTSATDLAVDSMGNVYINSETVVYKATIPTSPGSVALTKVASISVQSGQRFYALAFTPANSLATNEVLIGGDGNGELWSIDTTSGATQDLGNFGPDPGVSGDILALSGDLVFYDDAMSNPTGLATVRACKSGTTTCSPTSDYLVVVDMTALANAYKNKTPAATLLKSVFGGSPSALGTGTTYGDLFGLGAWEGTVFAFARKDTANMTPLLLTIDPTTGKGSVVSSAFSFTNGWSGAGVTTSATITVPLPN